MCAFVTLAGEIDASEFLQDAEEFALWQCFCASLRAGFSAMEIDYVILKDFCKRYSLDAIEVFLICKKMVGEIKNEDD